MLLTPFSLLLTSYTSMAHFSQLRTQLVAALSLDFPSFSTHGLFFWSRITCRILHGIESSYLLNLVWSVTVFSVFPCFS